VRRMGTVPGGQCPLWCHSCDGMLEALLSLLWSSFAAVLGVAGDIVCQDAMERISYSLHTSRNECPQVCWKHWIPISLMVFWKKHKFKRVQIFYHENQ